MARILVIDDEANIRMMVKLALKHVGHTVQTAMERRRAIWGRLATDLRRRYETGDSIRALAESTGRSYGFIHRILSESGTPLRGRGGATRGRKQS